MKTLNNSDGRMVRASASEAVDWGLILVRVKPMTVKLISTASVLTISSKAKRQCGEQADKSRLLVVPLGKALSKISPSRFGKQVAGNS